MGPHSIYYNSITINVFVVFNDDFCSDLASESGVSLLSSYVWISNTHKM